MSVHPDRLREGIHIVSLSEKDLPEIMEIESMSFTSPWSENLFRQELRNERVEVMGARFLNHLLGYVVLWHGFRETHIMNIAVHPHFRRRGIGSMLLEYAINRARMKSDVLLLEVRVSNVPAIQLYKRYGFLPIGLRRKYYSDNNEDALVMMKRL